MERRRVPALLGADRLTRGPADAGRVQSSAGAGHSLWFKDAIIYQLHVRSFFDSNGDGVGDFAGIAQRLDYLTDLGVHAI
jgi:maltose alpha-D-glucosyltransferase / alpha-amylase